MYQVNFEKLCEVRMGSPFNVAEINVKGNFVPSFEGYQFQDKYALSSSGSKCILTQWAIQENEPGFVLWYLSEASKYVIKSKRFKGLCKGLDIVGDKLFVSIGLFHATGDEASLLIEEITGVL